MSCVGDAYDNAMCESFFATLECELLDRHRFRTQANTHIAASTSSKAGTTRDAVIPRSITDRPPRGTGDCTVALGSSIDHAGAVSVSPAVAVP